MTQWREEVKWSYKQMEAHTQILRYRTAFESLSIFIIPKEKHDQQKSLKMSLTTEEIDREREKRNGDKNVCFWHHFIGKKKLSHYLKKNLTSIWAEDANEPEKQILVPFQNRKKREEDKSGGCLQVQWGSMMRKPSRVIHVELELSAAKRETKKEAFIKP